MWAVKTSAGPTSEDEVAWGAAFQEAARGAGVPTPAVRRSTAGTVLATVAGRAVRVHSWVDLDPPSAALDPVQVGTVLAQLHRVPFAVTAPVDPWYTDPVGAAVWDELIAALIERRAPVATDLANLRDELVALESLLTAPRNLRACHCDLFADNLRSTATGELCVFDFDNAGSADPSQELAVVLVEFATDQPERARALHDAYRDAGGRGRIEDRTSFSMAIAQLCHIVETGCRRWLDAATSDERDDYAAWVAEFTQRPLTRQVIDRLIEAVRGAAR